MTELPFFHFFPQNKRDKFQKNNINEKLYNYEPFNNQKEHHLEIARDCIMQSNLDAHSNSHRFFVIFLVEFINHPESEFHELFNRHGFFYLSQGLKTLLKLMEEKMSY